MTRDEPSASPPAFPAEHLAGLAYNSARLSLQHPEHPNLGGDPVGRAWVWLWRYSPAVAVDTAAAIISHAVDKGILNRRSATWQVASDASIYVNLEDGTRLLMNKADANKFLDALNKRLDERGVPGEPLIEVTN